MVYDILFDSFLDFLSFLYVGVKKDPGRVVCQSKIVARKALGHYYMTQETAECIPCKITEGSHGLHRSVANIFQKNGGGRVRSNRSNFDKVLGELL